MNIKKIIAREGLVLIGIIAVGFALLEFGNVWVGNWGFGILILGYPLYLVIRFIIWAVRTLRAK